MDWSLLIFVLVILLFAWRGFRGGIIASLGRVLAVIAGYTAAILGGGPAATWIDPRAKPLPRCDLILSCS